MCINSFSPKIQCIIAHFYLEGYSAISCSYSKLWAHFWESLRNEFWRDSKAKKVVDVKLLVFIRNNLRVYINYLLLCKTKLKQTKKTLKLHDLM